MNLNLKNVFSINPILFFEVVRILANVAVCVLPQQVFNVNSNNLHLLNTTFSYISRSINLQKFKEEINNVENRISNTLEDNKIKKELRELGIDVLPFCTIVDKIISSKEMPIFPNVQYYVYKIEEEDSVKKILEKIRKMEIEILNSKNIKSQLKNRLKIIKLEGELLGYPKCCINEFIKLKKKNILEGYKVTPEKKVIIDLLNSKMLEEFQKIIESSLSYFNESLYSLFSMNFYPCSIACRNAIKVGKICEEYLDNVENAFKKGYRCGLLFNAFYHIVTGYNSYITSKNKDSSYIRQISKHYCKLKPEIKEILDASKNVITNLHFGNAFIKNCVERSKM